MKINKLNNRCFSLAEAVIAIAILIYILVAFLVLYNSYSKFYNYQVTEMNLGNSARVAVKELQSAALQANQIIASHDFSGTTYSTDQDTLVLEMPSADSSGNIINGTYDYAVFYKAGEDLYKLIEADDESRRRSGLTLLGDSVSSITFTYNNLDLSQANKIEMVIEMQATSGGRSIQHNLDQDIYLRNL